MLAAISPDDAIHSMVREGRATAETFCRFLENIVRYTNKRIVIVVDKFSMHTAKIVKDRIAEDKGECEIHYQPAYSPEVNPVEVL